MRPESELIPYAAGQLEGSPVLALAPHPDDEVFGCGAVLVQAARAGAEVHTVVLTDGGAQGDPAVRYEESRAAAAALRLPEPEFWGLADRTLAPADEGLRGRLSSLLADLRPRLVLVPSTAELHPDHRALAVATFEVLRGTRALGSCDLACYEVSGFLRPNLLVDATRVWPEVMAAARHFGSQTGLVPYLEVMDAIATARRLSLPPRVERAVALHVTPLAVLRSTTLLEWAADQGSTRGIAPPSEPGGLPRRLEPAPGG